jgi:N-acetylmuramoyl-L-alanine amidase
MELNRRDLLKGAVAVTGAGSLTVFAAGGSASAATYPSLRMGTRGSAVLALQRRLIVLGYWLGKADGQYGDLTRQAVIAIQKVGGLQRDGQCGPLTWVRVNAGLRPKARTAKTSKAHVIEINKANQTLLIVHAGVVKSIYSTSTGSNQRYYQGKVWHTATTPSGTFRAFRQVNRWDDGPLGKLYRPKYFNRGIAIHGYASVPTTPASHGCARVSLPAMDSLWALGGIPLSTTVLVY